MSDVDTPSTNLHLHPADAPAKDAAIMVAGARGMVGSALVRRLRAGGYQNVLEPLRSELDLMDRVAVETYLAKQQPSYIYMAAAKVGGIQANNTYRSEFLHNNLVIQNNVIHGAHLAGVQRLMFFGSSCIYPRDCPQPIKEEYLLTGPLEPTNEPYAIAKIAGIKLCEAYSTQYGRQYISVMPTNLYGPNDNYDLSNSHVLPALMRKAYEARQRGDVQLVVWGSGNPRREFLHVDDLADACVTLMENGYDGPMLNIGTGEDTTITDLARLAARAAGFHGQLVFDYSKPDGVSRKLLDVSRMAGLGWHSSVALEDGIYATFKSEFGGKGSVVCD